MKNRPQQAGGLARAVGHPAVQLCLPPRGGGRWVDLPRRRHGRGPFHAVADSLPSLTKTDIRKWANPQRHNVDGLAVLPLEWVVQPSTGVSKIGNQVMSSKFQISGKTVVSFLQNKVPACDVPKNVP